jgi:AcrR family transcriptional regulator
VLVASAGNLAGIGNNGYRAVMHEPSGLRERKKAETRSALGAAALSLSLDRGVEAVTADEIAAAANVSPRTFRNYFSSKEEALAAGFRAILDGYVGELQARPADEPILTSLERVLAPIAASAAARREETQAHLALLSSPALARHRGLLLEETVRAFIGAVASRTGTDPRTDVFPRLVTTTAIAAVLVAYDLMPPGEAADDTKGEGSVAECFALLRAGLQQCAAARR